MKTKLLRFGSFFVVLSVLLFFNAPKPALAAACTKTSNVTVLGNWSASGSWSPSGVPGSSDVVCIADDDIVILDTDATIAELHVGGGSSGLLSFGNSGTTRTLTVNRDVIVNAGATLQTSNIFTAANQMNISGDLTNASSNAVDFVGSSGSVTNVTFNKAGTQNISSTGTGGFDFNNVTINSGTTLSVNANVGNNRITIEGTLTIASGAILNTGTSTVNVTGTYTNNGQLKHSQTQTINSVALRSYVDGTNNATADISGNATLGSTTVNSAAGGTNPYDTNCGTLTTTVFRFWQITAGTPGNATVKFYYRASEINGLTNGNLQMWKCSVGATQWVQQGGTYSYSTGATYNTVQSDTVTVGSTFVLASSGAPTAVSLSNANAFVTADNEVVLNWTTGSEINTAGFNLYRSESEDGPYARINPQLIPASGEALLGGTYE